MAPKGWLVGEAHKGLAGMFVMMNKERLFVGGQGVSIAELAYQNAAAYAKERLQGRAAEGVAFPEKPADPIIVHPDIRNRLMFSRSVIEAARALALWTNRQADFANKLSDGSERQKADDMVSLMTPIVKAASTDFGSEIANTCLQVFGGHGYIREHGMEQMVRDVRITQIYEGTNSIQAMDLVGRKLGLDGGRLFKGWLNDVEAMLDRLDGRNDIVDFTMPLKEAIERLKACTQWLFEDAKADPNARGAAACDYLRLFSLTAYAWVWTLMAEAALDKKGEAGDFYDTKLNVGRYFMRRVLPESVGLEEIIRSGSKPMMTLPESAF